MKVVDQEYSIDEQLVKRLATGLFLKDPKQVERVLDDINHRIYGGCFCYARSTSECLCGAWEGVWESEEGEI